MSATKFCLTNFKKWFDNQTVGVWLTMRVKYWLLLLPAFFFACQTLTQLRPKDEKRPAVPVLPQPLPAKSAPKSVVPAGVPITHIGPAYKSHMFDCIENTSASTTLRFPHAKLNFFSKEPETSFSFHLTEENGWPFLVGYYKRKNYNSNGDYLVALRGEASGWHKSAATNAVLSLVDQSENNGLLLLDEYSYVDKDEKSRRKSVMPICHRSYHKNGYLGTEIPGFRKGGANRLLRRVLPAQGSVVIVSYSNGTSPRGEFIPREPAPDYKPDYRNFQDPAKFLINHILETRFVDSVYPNIRGFIDIEGNFEFTKSFWDLLAYIKLEIEPRGDRFFYSTARIEKFDAYPGQVVMINALGLKGKEGADGVIRYQNKRGNVIIDIVTNAYQPNYWNVGKDIRTVTKMEPYKGKDMVRTRLSHFNIPDWAAQRILTTTPFLAPRAAPLHTSLLLD